MDAPESLGERLAAARAVTEAHLAALTRDFDGVVEAAADVATDDEHDPDGATIAFERAQLAGLIDTARRRLTELDAALDRLASGTYGRCADCGASIPVERLEARPATTRCVTCAGKVRR